MGRQRRAGRFALCVRAQVVRVCKHHPDQLNARVPHARSRAGLPPSNGISDPSERHFVANIKSQLKRIKTNAKATERNKAVKSELRTEIRKTREACVCFK